MEDVYATSIFRLELQSPRLPRADSRSAIAAARAKPDGCSFGFRDTSFRGLGSFVRRASIRALAACKTLALDCKLANVPALD